MKNARQDLMALMAALGDRGKAIGKAADEAYDTEMRGAQDYLKQLIKGDSAVDSFRDGASRMAGSEAALMALKAVPAVGLGAGLFMGGEDETFANQAMDILGVGAGMYGINKGVGRLGGTTPAGAAMRLGALGVGALGGNIGIDVLQSALQS